MSIDVSEPLSPGWWLQRLSQKLTDRSRRLDLLDDYYRGRPPLPYGADSARDAYRAFQKQARTNWAELVVEAARERMKLVGFRTAAGGDDNGDAEATQVAAANALDVESAEVHRMMLEFGDSYAIVGDLDPDTGQPVITAEDPREVVTAHDPAQQRRVRAAAKLFRDPDENVMRAYQYLPGRVWVAVREGAGHPKQPVRFNASGWDWDPQFGGAEGTRLPFDRVPVVRFRNRRGIGEYELHTDVLDRINFMILQRMVITIFQAFKQRAVKGDLPDVDPKTGKEIDYDAVFSADPGALWQLPEAVELWESGQADIAGILQGARHDIQDLAAVTRTPLHYLNPEGANQSAEGAALAREGLVFKTEDRIARANQGWQQVMSLAFLWKDDLERARLAEIQPMWADPERRSLAERADAAVKAKAAEVPWRERMTSILGFDPATVERMETERAGDALLQAALQPAPAAPEPAVTGEPDGDTA